MSDRELSPYSARVALTKKLQQGPDAPPAPEGHKSRPWDTRGPPERAQNGHSRSPVPGRGKRWDTKPLPSRERSREGKDKRALSPPRSLRERSPEERSRDVKPKSTSIEPTATVRDREASPEPYRKPREASRDRNKDRSRERDPRSNRDHSTDRHRTKDTDRSRDRERAKDKDRSRERDQSKDRDDSRARHSERRRERSGERRRDGSRERRRSRDRERKRDRSKDRHQDRHRDRERDRDRDRSRNRDRNRRHDRDRALKRRSPSSSPPPKRRRKRTRSPSRSPSPHRRSKQALPAQEISFRGADNSDLPPTKYGGAPTALEKPNFKPTGLLAKAANKVEGTKISLKYHEPPEARKPSPSQAWRIIVFKGDDVVDTIELGAKSCWLLGRSAEVVDYVLEHPSSSGQHAVIQFRYVQKTVEDEFGVKKVKGKVKPYVIDLESSNGTELNGERVETSRYHELRDKDILKFAGSEREYVVVLPPPEEQKS